jgi:hypothetical protein
VTLQTAIFDITDRTTDPVNGFRAPEGGDNKRWFRAFDQLAQLRREAIGASAHHLVVVIDVAVLHANAQGEATRSAWFAAYAALREAIVCERGTA